MSVAISSVCTSSFDSMPDSEKPVVAIKIMPSAASATSRRAFHLVLILDTSGSMEGQRITAVKRTLNLLIDAMANDDIITMIEYSSDASIIADTISISDESRVTLHSAVDTIRADGGTNMESAFLKLREISSKSSVDSVFVMTDGQINQGCTSSAGLIRILSASIPSGTPVNTLGYGHDHNIRLLRDIGVRSRGTYTYADSDELIPAIIGDIMGGLAAEVGRNGVLAIPAGWKCMELGAADTDTTYTIGTLIAEKPQWVVLEGPVKSDIPELPTFTFTWSVAGAEHTETSVVGTDMRLNAIDATEQSIRARVAVTFGKVSELLESGAYAEAKTLLEDLATTMDSSTAKDRTLVIQMRAQVDDMLDSVGGYTNFPAMPMGMPSTSWAGFGLPPMPGLQRQMAVSSSYAGMAPPALAPVLSRLASNTATLGMQRGIMSGGSALAPTFSSPTQRQASSGLTQQYLHEPYDPDFHANSIAPASPALLAAVQGLTTVGALELLPGEGTPVPLGLAPAPAPAGPTVSTPVPTPTASPTLAAMPSPSTNP